MVLKSMKIKNKKIFLQNYTHTYDIQSTTYTFSFFHISAYITIFIEVIRAIHNHNSINLLYIRK